MARLVGNLGRKSLTDLVVDIFVIEGKESPTAGVFVTAEREGHPFTQRELAVFPRLDSHGPVGDLGASSLPSFGVYLHCAQRKANSTQK